MFPKRKPSIPKKETRSGASELQFTVRKSGIVSSILTRFVPGLVGQTAVDDQQGVVFFVYFADSSVALVERTNEITIM